MAFWIMWNLKFEIESDLTTQITRYLPQEERWVIDASYRPMLETAYYRVLFCLEVSKRVFGWGKPFEVVEEAVSRLKQAIQSHVNECNDFDLEKEIHLFTQTMHELQEEFADRLYSLPGGGGGEEDEVVPYAENTKMVGFSNQYKYLKNMLIDDYKGLNSNLQAVSLTGMPGIGKTTLAREVFKDPKIMKHFDCRVWVRVGRNCGLIEMLRCILVEMGVKKGGDIDESLNRSLKGKRYLIVLDDVWDRYVATCLTEKVYSRRGTKSQLKYPFPSEDNGSRLLVTSRLDQESPHPSMEMELMNKEESWDLLREKVFGQGRCPPQLEKLGKKIVEKCEGHPLTIVTVAKLLSREDKTPEYWNEVATKKRHPLFKAAYDEMYKVLLPSFNHLPPCLQKCFMYIGMFPQDYQIPQSKLINLWMADGFLDHIDQKSLSLGVAVNCLWELVHNNMVMIKESKILEVVTVSRHIKTCKLHSCLRYLSNREGRSSKFCHVLDSFDDGFGEDIKAQPRLSFHNNVLFAIKDVNKSVEDNCASTAHSLFCYGPYLQYQVPICFGLRLLKKLDAIGIRFYEFPFEVLQLVELRYLALTMNGNLPTGVSQLRKLRFLIVHPHQRIKSWKESSYLPMEIWNLQELEHLEVMGKDLPNPLGASLDKLSTLAKVSPNSCTVDVLEALPNLRQLRIEVELRHDNDGDPFSCLAHVGRLEQLDSLKCVVVNPTLSYSFPSVLSIPRNLTKLTLNGLGYEWKEIEKGGSLENLGILKLRNFAFRGPEWKVGIMAYSGLHTLIIEDTDVERLRIRRPIQILVLKRCYKLIEFYCDFEYESRIEIVDCNPICVQQLKQIIPEHATLTIRCSWYDEKPKP